MDALGKPFRKFDQKFQTQKNQSEIASCEQKTSNQKAHFVETPFFHYFKIRAKISRRKTTRFFVQLCFDVTKITNPI